jgi:tyrocidine synthetase-3
MSKSYISGEATFVAAQYTKEREFWLNKLSGDLVKSNFPYDHKKKGVNKQKTDYLKFEFSPELVSKLITAMNKSDFRLHMILVAGLLQLIHKYTSNRDIIIGTPVYKQEVEGSFINTVLTLRNRFENNMTFRDLLMRVRQTIAEASNHINYPIEILPYDLGLTLNEDDDFPLFDIAIVLENVHNKKHIDHININMIVFFKRTGDNLEGVVRYNSYLYNEKTVERITRYFTSLLQKTIFSANLKISDFSMLSNEEKEQLLFDFNNTSVEYPKEMTIWQLFEKQVEDTPDNIAVAAGDQQLTYRKLNEAANGIAALLIKKGVKVNTISGIMGKRSVWIIEGILGILKAGGTYLPINGNDPEGRIKFILEDSKASVLMTQKHLVEKNRSLSTIDSLEHIILIEDLTRQEDAGINPAVYLSREHFSKPGDNMYLIYTSGTTGKPKGVIVKHRNIVNYIWWAAEKYVKNENVNFPLYTSIAFDLTVTSIFTPLLTGNAVVVYEGDSNESLIEKIVDENKVGVVKLTPSHLKLIRDIKIDGRLSSIKRFILGGEELDARLAKEINENFNGNIEIYNEYGPTESAVGSMIYKFNPQKDNEGTVPIGIPVNNTQIYLLNEDLEPVPFGAKGEIYIGGDGVAYGYLQRPGLTAEKFMPNPFICGKKMYRTGDLARRLENDSANIEFLGRVDNQVKIRGYRVESGEIESRLIEHDEINDSVVIAKEDKNGDNYLCAYIVSDREFPISELREYLEKELPDYMIPSYFAQLDSIPLTQNGKIDKKALPEVEAKVEVEYIAPRNEMERRLVKIWSDILHIEESILSIDLNFFEAGGHSLKATVLISRIHNEFNLRVPLESVFRALTIREFAEYLSKSIEDMFFSIKVAQKKEYYALSSAQKRLYILQQMNTNSIAYNVPFIRVLEGDIDLRRLEDTFIKLINKHETLRTSFGLVNDEPVQKIHKHVEFGIRYYDPGEQDKEKIINNFVKPFDLSKAPLVRVGVIKESEIRIIVMYDVHHIVTDAVSMELFVQDFMALYAGEELQKLKYQYKDFSEWQNSEKEKEVLKKQEVFWLKQFEEGIPPSLNLPVDFARSKIQSFEGDELTFEINAEKTESLKNMALAGGVTLFMVLFAIYSILLSKICNQQGMVIGTPVAGRKHVDLEQIMGMFVNTLAIKVFPRGDITFTEFLGDVKKITLDVLENQDYQIEDLVDKIVGKRDASRNPLFDTMFTLQNMQISELEIAGLKLKTYEYQKKISKIDVQLICSENEDKLHCIFEYCTKRFKRESIEVFIGYFNNIASYVLDNPRIKISEIQLVSEEERKSIEKGFIDELEYESF